MAPLTSSQKQLVTQFVSFTQTDKKTAEKALRNHNWNVQTAVDGFFNLPQASSGAYKGAEATLNKMFDKYRDDPTNSPDTIQMTGAMAYFKDVDISIEDTSLLVASEFLGCPSLGDIPRSGFTSAWAPLAATSVAAQKAQLAGLTKHFTQPEARLQGGLYRRVYKHTFKLACPAGSKSVPLETAAEFWKMLFSAGGLPWASADGKTAWLDLYLGFLQERWKKAVNKDLWDQTLLFALKTLEDESLSWWSEDSAWPGVIDEFVAWTKKRRDGGGDADAMEE